MIRANRENLVTALGYLFFIGMMGAGYYYNVTFVQLGLVDLGQRILQLTETAVATHMSYLAIVTGITAIGAGTLMFFRAGLRQFHVRLRILSVLITVQTILTALIMAVHDESTFLLWIVSVAVLLGIAVPISFSMTVDLVAVPHRGYVAAVITAVAYFAAVLLSSEWEIVYFRNQMIVLMLPATIALCAVAWIPNPLVRQWAKQHLRPTFGIGRLIRNRHTFSFWRLLLFLCLMFGIFFIDSLGFLRLVDTPLYMNSAWQSPDYSVRLFIAGTHVVAAAIAGILYTYLDVRGLFLWVFGIFSLVHLEYSFHAVTALGDGVPLSMPMLYATAVSLYTVISFAIWADLASPRTAGILTAVGVALSGWTATFASTALAIHWQNIGLQFEEHLRLVNAIAIVFFLTMLVLLFFGKANQPEPASQQRVES